MSKNHFYLVATFIGLTPMLTMGCGDSPGPIVPTTGAIEITVSTASENVAVDPDGYVLSVVAEPGLRIWLPAHSVGVNAIVTVVALPTGKYLVRLDGLAPNCSVSGTNPRSVDVITDEAASTVSFSVSCLAQTDTGAGDWDY
jgi:hypothetical protein